MLTEEQLELWNLVAPEDVTARDGQSLLQARLSAVVGFLLACQFDGVPAPTEQEARACAPPSTASRHLEGRADRLMSR